MRNLIYVFLLSFLLLPLWFCTSSSSGKEKQHSQIIRPAVVKKGSGKVAVLELFTSQGCSSCPPADRLLGTYSSKENVVVLSFHVDYWNRFGWQDPFSSRVFTERQSAYSSLLKADVYTPQLFINGESEMVGSDQGKISATLKKVLAGQPGAALSLKTVKPENGLVKIDFVASGITTNSILNIALIQKKAATDVKAGENGGATLINYNVVRNFKTISEVNNGDNTTTINVPAGITDNTNLSVVVYLQEKNTNKISAADQAGL